MRQRFSVNGFLFHWHFKLQSLRDKTTGQLGEVARSTRKWDEPHVAKGIHEDWVP